MIEESISPEELPVSADGRLRKARIGGPKAPNSRSAQKIRESMVREKARELGTEAEELRAVVREDHPQIRVEDIDDKASTVLDWYVKGFYRASELSKLTKLSEAPIRSTYLPAVMRRLASGRSHEEIRAEAQLAAERELNLLRHAWNELLRAGKPSVKAQWAQIVQNCHRELNRLNGIGANHTDQKVYLVAVNTLITSVLDVAQSTNDPALLQRFEGVLEEFISARAIPLPGGEPKPEIVIGAEYTQS